MTIEVSTYESSRDHKNIRLSDDSPYEGKQRVEVSIGSERALVEVKELLAALRAIEAIAEVSQ